MTGDAQRPRSAPRPLVRWGAATVITVAIAGMAAGIARWLAPPQNGAGAARVIVMTARPLVSRLSVVGTVEPGSAVAITAPLDGAIREKAADYGSRVAKDQPLLVMDTADLEMKLREAEVAALRASRTMEEMRGWADSPDVSRAKRNVLSSRLALEENRQKADESRLLLERGIVARQEWETLDRQTRTLQIELEAAEQELKVTLDKGNETNRRIAALELGNARDRLADLQSQRDHATILAPMAGIVLRPAQGPQGQSAQPPIEVGTRVTRGQTLFTIAGTDHLTVTARVDETDINRISEGQAVEVGGEAFGTPPLDGRITQVSAQATPSAAGGATTFGISVEIHPDAARMRQIRIGMSSTLTLTLYQNPHALVLPPEALQRDAEGPYVLKEVPGSDQPAVTRVTPGRPVEEGIEVISGLKENDRVLLP